MLTPNDKELIAKSLDGPLPATEQGRVRQLLDHSAEARTLRAKLKQDRDRLRQLTARKAPQTLLPQVMARVVETSPFATIPGSTLRPKVRRSPWVTATVAASVLALVSLGTYYSVKYDAAHTQRRDHAQALPKIEDHETAIDDKPVLVSRIAGFEEPQLQVPNETNVAKGPEQAPTPRTVEVPPPAPVYASPLVIMPKLDSVLVKLPMIAAVNDLARDDVRKRLVTELQSQSVMRVDLFATDAAKGVEAFQNAAIAAGLHLTVEAVAHDRLRKKLPGAWLVFTESLTAADATDLFVKLAPAADASPSAKVFDSLHVVAASATDRKELKDLLGVDLTPIKKEAAAKSVTANTIDQLTNSLSKSKSDRSGIVVTYLPPNLRAAFGTSKEIKSWTEHRGEKKPGAVSLLVVIR
ncbi:hypothetical protein BH11PLA2_BH11PLA2_10190 [soil metagenome]